MRLHSAYRLSEDERRRGLRRTIKAVEIIETIPFFVRKSLILGIY